MTIKERLSDLLGRETWPMGDGGEPATVDKMIITAYYMGRESATRKVSDDYRSLISRMRDRARSVRYSKMAQRIIGDEDYIYEPDYAGDMTTTYGNDQADM